MPRSADKNEQLMRCICGKVFDAALVSECPDCGEIPAAVKTKTDKLPVSRSGTSKSSDAEKPLKKMLSVKQIASAGVLLLLLAFAVSRMMGSSSGGTGSAPDSKHETSDSVKKNVDREFVGTWVMMIPVAQGQQKWALNVSSNGTYQFSATGAGVGSRHSGKFSAQNGSWSLEATEGLVWSDQGTYTITGGKTLLLTGKLGTGTWYREK